MKTVIEIALDHYCGFFKRCDPACREYEILEIGPILRRSKESHHKLTVEIHCEMQGAQILLDAARRLYPDAVLDIEKAIAAPEAQQSVVGRRSPRANDGFPYA
jgi:hypothetical protein